MNQEIYLIVFAPVYGPSGYAKLSRKFILGLDKLGVKIKLEPNRIWEPHKAILPPDEEKRLNELENTVIPSCCMPAKLSIGIAPWFDKEYQGYKIGYTMFEFSNVPEIGRYDWKTSCMAMDEIWVPSQYNYRTFIDNGINNVFVIAPGIDVNLFNSNKSPLIDRTDGKFRFLAVGEYNSRKGWDLLIPAYLAEFDRSDDVTLIVKAYNGSKGVVESKRMIKEDIIKYRTESPNVLYPHIMFIGDILSADRLPNLYNSADCLLMLTRGEGFGLPMAEAMACERPCIVPNNSAYLDFINNENGYLVNINGFEKDNLLYKSSMLYRDSESPIIDIKHARKLMRYAYEHQNEIQEKGLKARQTIMSDFTVEQAALRMFNRLQQLDVYFNENVVNVVTDNFDELLLEERDYVARSEEELLNINVIRSDMKVQAGIMLIPTWGENCGVADYTRRLVDSLKGSQNVLIVKNLYNLVDTVKRQGINLIHIQHHYSFYNYKTLVEVIKELKMLNCKVILTVHDYAFDNAMKPHNECFRYCDYIIVHSNLIRNQMIKDKVVDKNKISVIIMGADEPYHLKKNDAQKNIKIQGKKIISSFGFLQPHKNWVEVVKAIDILRKDIPNILYLIMSVNRNSSDAAIKYNKSLDSMVARLGISDHVKRFNSYLPEERILQMLAASDIIALPYSNYKINGIEYWGVSIASRFAMRVQRPLLVSNASFFSDLESICHVIEPNAQSIAEGIKDILNSDALERKIVLRQYNFCIVNSWNNLKDRMIEIYQSIIK